MTEHEKLISTLSGDLAPVANPPNVTRLALVWFMVSAVYVVAVIHLFGSARPGAFSQLATEPRFLAETLLGVAAILWVSLLAFRSAVPAALSKPFVIIGVSLMALWLAQYVVGLISPALEPSILGKRKVCQFETLIYSLPAILAGLLIVRRLYPLRPLRTAMAIGLAAGMLPALYMQLACMYEPAHILSFHIAPGLLMVAVSAAIAARLQWRRGRSDMR